MITLRPLRTLLLAFIAVAFLASAGALAGGEPAFVDLELENQPLIEVFESLARQCGTGLMIDQACIRQAVTPTSFRLAHVPWATAVEHFAANLGLAVMLGDDHLLVRPKVGTQTGPGSALASVRYEMQALTEPLHKVTGPTLALPQAEGSHIGPPFESETKPELNEYIELLQKYVAPDSWRGNGVQIMDFAHNLMIIAKPSIHALIAQALAKLEAMHATQLSCRFYRLDEAPVEAAGALDAASWARISARATLAEAFLVQGGIRQHVFSGNERLYLAALEPSQGTLWPLINALGTGINLDLTLLPAADGVFMRMNAMITVAASWPRHVLADDHGNAIGELTTPELFTDAISDMRLIPPGGAALFHCGTRQYALTADSVHPVDDHGFGPWLDPDAPPPPPATTAPPAPPPPPPQKPPPASVGASSF